MHPRHFLDARLLERYGTDANAALYGAALTDDEWASVSNSANRIGVGEHAFVERVLRQIVRGRRTYLLPLLPQRRGRAAPVAPRIATGRATAVAALLVNRLQATEDRAGIMAFRRDVLGNRLRRPQSIARWVRAQQRKSTTPFSGRTLAYRIPTSEWTQHVGTRAGSTLDRLRVASERVAAFTGWTLADATVFILTDVVPVMPAVRAEVHYQPTMSVRSRIVLTIDPTATPAEVTAAYRRVRRSNFGRPRRLGAKRTALARFVLEHAQLSARDQMTLWNAQRGRGRYRQLGQFNRDCEQALRRLANPLRPPQLR